MKTKDEEIVLQAIIHSEIGLYTTLHGPGRAVVSITGILTSVEGMTKYRARKALNALVSEGLVEYTSQGRPAIVSYGEVTELVCEAMPPVNGYALTQKGFKTKEWADAYAAWEKDMGLWANGSEAAEEE